MKQSITQEQPYGCGIACFAFVSGITYQEAEDFLGIEQARSERFIVKHFREELNRNGLVYSSKHIKFRETINPIEGMIVLLRRSSNFPVGHYLTFHYGKWMDPWINLPDLPRKSGFRNILPGEVMYAISPS